MLKMMSETKIPPLNPTSQTRNQPDGSWLFDSYIKVLLSFYRLIIKNYNSLCNFLRCCRGM